jgi:uncharacterized membrane-anchored protein
MIRLLVILIAAGLVALGAAWIADHDSVMMLTVANYEIRTTVAVAILLLLFCFLALWLVLRVAFTILKGLAGAHRVAVARKPDAPRLMPAAAEIMPDQDRTLL